MEYEYYYHVNQKCDRCGREARRLGTPTFDNLGMWKDAEHAWKENTKFAERTEVAEVNCLNCLVDTGRFKRYMNSKHDFEKFVLEEKVGEPELGKNKLIIDGVLGEIEIKYPSENGYGIKPEGKVVVVTPRRQETDYITDYYGWDRLL
jgi:hypothetical protein